MGGSGEGPQAWPQSAAPAGGIGFLFANPSGESEGNRAGGGAEQGQAERSQTKRSGAKSHKSDDKVVPFVTLLGSPVWFSGWSQDEGEGTDQQGTGISKVGGDGSGADLEVRSGQGKEWNSSGVQSSKR